MPYSDGGDMQYIVPEHFCCCCQFRFQKPLVAQVGPIHESEDVNKSTVPLQISLHILSERCLPRQCRRSELSANYASTLALKLCKHLRGEIFQCQYEHSTAIFWQFMYSVHAHGSMRRREHARKLFCQPCLSRASPERLKCLADGNVQDVHTLDIHSRTVCQEVVLLAEPANGAGYT